MTTQFPSAEYELIHGIVPFCKSRLPQKRYEITVGDDAAIRTSSAGEKVILTTDLSVEEVHFSLKYLSLEEIGYRSMVSNLSDCAAMGAEPDSALVNLVFPQKTRDLERLVGELYRGFSQACMEWNFPIVGGDLSGGPIWVIGITLLGRVGQGERLLLRTGIQDGDELWCTGIPGQSAAGLDALSKWGRSSVPEQFHDLLERHIRPQPRIKTGRSLASNLEIHAMMDISDGLTKDGGTLCYDNKLGLIIDINSSQIPDSMIQLSQEMAKPWTDWVLHGGEEYELLFSASPHFKPDSICADQGCQFVKIGKFTKNYSGVHIKNNDGQILPLEQRSWDHVKRAMEK